MEIWCHNPQQTCPEKVEYPSVEIKSDKCLGCNHRVSNTYQSHDMKCIQISQTIESDIKTPFICQSTILENVQSIEVPFTLASNDVYKDQEQERRYFTDLESMQIPIKDLPTNLPVLKYFHLHFVVIVMFSLFTTIFPHLMVHLFGRTKLTKNLKGIRYVNHKASFIYLSIWTILSALAPISSQGIIKCSHYKHRLILLLYNKFNF